MYVVWKDREVKIENKRKEMLIEEEKLHKLTLLTNRRGSSRSRQSIDNNHSNQNVGVN